MKKMMMLAAMLALVLAVGAPALAQVSQGLAERNTTGNVTTTGTATSKGDNSNQCVAPLQFGNTAPQQNTQGVLQYGSTTDGVFGDIGLTGGSFIFGPELTAPCTPAVEQSSAASSR